LNLPLDCGLQRHDIFGVSIFSEKDNSCYEILVTIHETTGCCGPDNHKLIIWCCRNSSLHLCVVDRVVQQ